MTRKSAVLCAFFALSPLLDAKGKTGEKKILAPIPLELAAKGVKTFNWSTSFDLSPGGKWIVYSHTTDEVAPIAQRNQAPYSDTGVPRTWGARTEVRLIDIRTSDVVQVSDQKSWSWAPVWSPNGARLAFYSDEGGEAGLWIWDATTRQRHRFPGVIVRPYQYRESVQWSADGRYVICKILPKGMTIASANALTVLKNQEPQAEGRIPFPDVKPGEASYIVLKSSSKGVAKIDVEKPARQAEDVNSAIADFVILDLENNAVQPIIERSQVRWYEYSPNGEYIAYSIFKSQELETYEQKYDLALYSLKTGKNRSIGTELRFSYGGEGCTWSPHSSRLACYTSEPRTDLKKQPNPEISTVSLADGVVKTLKTSIKSIGGYPAYPLWDENEKQIFVIGTDETPTDTRDWYRKRRDRIWRVDAESGQSTVLSEIIGHQITGVIPPVRKQLSLRKVDDQSIWVFARKQDDDITPEVGIFKIDTASGKNKFVLKVNGGWGNTARFNPDTGEVAYLATDFQRPSEVYLFDPKKNKSRQITHLNAEWERYQLGTGQLLEYYDTDGRKLHGGLVLPVGYKPGQKVPLVVFAFGWPNDSNYVNSFGMFGTTPSYNMHVLATRGYAILQPDMPLRPGTQMKDVLDTTMPGVNEAINKGFVDPDRLAVIGYSIGSYTGLALIVQTRRFKAAAIGGVNVFPDFFIGYLLRDPLQEGPTTYEQEQGNFGMGGTPWTARDKYVNNSPAVFFDRVETPLLLAQGTKDGLDASNVIFSGLSRLKKDVEYLVYKDEDHSISAIPGVIDFWKRRLEFFDTHLDIARDADGHIIYDGDRPKTAKKPVAVTETKASQ